MECSLAGKGPTLGVSEALGLIPELYKQSMVAPTSKPSSREVEAGELQIQSEGHPQLYSKLEVTLGCVRPYLKI